MRDIEALFKVTVQQWSEQRVESGFRRLLTPRRDTHTHRCTLSPPTPALNPSTLVTWYSPPRCHSPHAHISALQENVVLIQPTAETSTWTAISVRKDCAISSDGSYYVLNKLLNTNPSVFFKTSLISWDRFYYLH